MKSKSYFILLSVLIGYSVASVAQQVDTLRENEVIRRLIKSYEDAWNLHDPVGLGACYRSDATLVNWFGAYYKGRKDIVDHYRTTHNTYFKAYHYYTRAVEDVFEVKY